MNDSERFAVGLRCRAQESNCPDFAAECERLAIAATRPGANLRILDAQLIELIMEKEKVIQPAGNILALAGNRTGGLQAEIDALLAEACAAGLVLPGSW